MSIPFGVSFDPVAQLDRGNAALDEVDGYYVSPISIITLGFLVGDFLYDWIYCDADATTSWTPVADETTTWSTC